MATNALIRVLENKGVEYKINPGDGAFWAKIDFHVLTASSAAGSATIQLDSRCPSALTSPIRERTARSTALSWCTGYGAIDRFLGILIEHFAGAFPVWLSPTG